MLRPSLTLKDIFGPKRIFNGRPSYAEFGWLPPDSAKSDASTGLPLIFAGDMPTVCHQFVLKEEGLALLNNYLDISPYRYIYHSKEEYLDLLRSFGSKKRNLIFNYLHPLKEVNPASYWINPSTIGYLNNKANMPKLVPSEYLPKQRLISLNELTDPSLLSSLPFVLKSATDEPNGGGFDVLFCKSNADLQQAKVFFFKSEKILLEEFLEIKANYCIQFVKTYKGQILFLGASEQIVKEGGYYSGNWLEKKEPVPQILLELGYSIMERACNSKDYIGVAGFDIVLTSDNRIIALDLNFRLNGSTPLLLFKDSLFNSYNPSVLKFRSWSSELPFTKLLSICRDLVAHKKLLPLSFYCSDQINNSNSFFSGILMGVSKEAILATEKSLAKAGIS